MNSAGFYSRLQTAAGWLTPRRLRIHAVCLALCVWALVAADFSLPGLKDRAGNVKFQDFLQFYIAGQQVRQGRFDELYNPKSAEADLQRIVGSPTAVRLPPVYGPQVGLFFAPFSRLTFLRAAILWTALSTILYFLCCYGVWRMCPALRGSPGLVAVAACGFPAFFSFFVRGQVSAALLACFVVALFALRGGQDFLAGLALGALALKPPFLVGILPVIAMGRAWKICAGVAVAILLQVGGAWLYFGRTVLWAYAATLWHLPRRINVEEPGFSNAQMHSLRAFWVLLAPHDGIAMGLYGISAVLIVVLAARAWRCRGPLSLRFSSLVLVAVLVDPHLFVYGLLVLAPVILLLSDWAIRNAEDPRAGALRILLYLTYIFPLFGPLTRWTHFQLSVPVFVILQWVLWDVLRRDVPSSGVAAMMA